MLSVKRRGSYYLDTLTTPRNIFVEHAGSINFITAASRLTDDIFMVMVFFFMKHKGLRKFSFVCFSFNNLIKLV